LRRLSTSPEPARRSAGSYDDVPPVIYTGVSKLSRLAIVMSDLEKFFPWLRKSLGDIFAERRLKFCDMDC
jgi:hypothetical protein